MYYPVSIPWLVKKLYPSLFWAMPGTEKNLYLSFDDGPHATATPFVLEQLKQFNAKATFFCIGKNVVELPELYRQILDAGHAVGNHTFNHLNGWKTKDKAYIDNIFEARKYIDSQLFRPPYGRITRFQMKLLQLKDNNGVQETAAGFTPATANFKIIMWDILSGDFDITLSPQKCLQNVVLHAKPGSIIVFHDSAKAWDRLQYALPKVLEHFTAAGYSFKALPSL